MRIQRKAPRTGVLTAWIENDEYFIRESLDRGKDVQTVALTRTELEKILAIKQEPDHV